MKFRGLAISALAVIVVSALAQQGAHHQASRQHMTRSIAKIDSEFLERAAEDTIAEIQASNLVMSKTQNARVKSACKVMIKDHTKALGQLRQLGSRYGVTLPSGPNAEHQTMMQHLQNESGKELDKDWVGDQIQDHVSDINNFTSEVHLSKTPDVRSFAQKTLPVLAKHAQIWRKLAPEFGIPATFGRKPASEIRHEQKH